MADRASRYLVDRSSVASRSQFAASLRSGEAGGALSKIPVSVVRFRPWAPLPRTWTELPKWAHRGAMARQNVSPGADQREDCASDGVPGGAVLRTPLALAW